MQCIKNKQYIIRIMTDKEISAIAQEYANETIRQTKDGFRKLAVKLKAKTIRKFLQWLLYRYCLVEKDKVIETYI